MLKIDVIVPKAPRGWQHEIVTRLIADGHNVAISSAEHSDWPLATQLALALESRVLRRAGVLSAPSAVADTPSGGPPDLRLDLLGTAPASSVPTVRIAFAGRFDDGVVVAELAAGRLVDLDLVIDGRVLAHAEPMVDNRVFVAAAIEDILARVVTLTLKAVDRFANGERGTALFAAAPGRTAFTPAYLASALPRVGREVMRRLRYRHAHWRVGYRLTDGLGVAETARLGIGWSVLPDDGTHFYADPFPFEHDGRQFIFLEDYPHATKKAVISVTELRNGVAGPVRPVLEEPHHLSYPQVFAADGQIWMLPEASASGRLTLYRADRFPESWTPAAVLLTGEISDATLFVENGRYWLIATDRDGGGSTSDTLVVFHAPSLTGPWIAHRQNPILIDRRRARPGGFVTIVDGKRVLPVQDGTLGYGGGLGLSEIIRLDAEAVELGAPRPISGDGDFAYPQIHTLNRAGRLEVIDGIAAVRKR